MKKFLSIIAAIGLTATTATAVVACGTSRNNDSSSEETEKIIEQNVKIELSEKEINLDEAGQTATFSINNYEKLVDLEVEGIDGAEPEFNKNTGEVTITPNSEGNTGVLINARNAKKYEMVPVNVGPKKDFESSIDLSRAKIEMNLFDDKSNETNVKILNFAKLKHVRLQAIDNSPFVFENNNDDNILIKAKQKGSGVLIITAANAPAIFVQIFVSGKEEVKKIEISSSHLEPGDNNIILDLDNNKNADIKINNDKDLEKRKFTISPGGNDLIELNENKNGEFTINAKGSGLVNIIFTADNVKEPVILNIKISEKASVDPPEEGKSGIEVDKPNGLQLDSNVSGNAGHIKDTITIKNIDKLSTVKIVPSAEGIIDYKLNEQTGIIDILVKQNQKDDHVGLMITAANSKIPLLLNIKIGTPSGEKNKDLKLNKSTLNLELNGKSEDKTIKIINENIEELGHIELMPSNDSIETKLEGVTISVKAKKSGGSSIIVLAEKAKEFKIIDINIVSKEKVPNPVDPPETDPNNPENSGIEIDKNLVKLSVQSEPSTQHEIYDENEEETPVDPETTPKSDVVTIENYEKLEDVNLTIVNKEIIDLKLNEQTGKIDIKSKSEVGNVAVIISAKNTERPRILNIEINQGKDFVNPKPDEPNNPENSGISVDKNKVSLDENKNKDTVLIKNYKDLLDPSIKIYPENTEVIKNNIVIDKTGKITIESNGVYGNATILILAKNSISPRLIHVEVKPSKPMVEKGIELNKEEVILNIGQKDKEIIEVKNFDNLVNLRISNKVNEGIKATLTEDGKIIIEARKNGNSTIVLSADNSKIVTIINVKVEGKKIINSIKTDVDSLTIKKDETKQVKITNYNDLENVKIISSDETKKVDLKLDSQTGVISVSSKEKMGQISINILASNVIEQPKIIKVILNGQKDTTIKLNDESIIKTGITLMAKESYKDLKITNYIELDDINADINSINADVDLEDDGQIIIRAHNENSDALDIKISASNAKTIIIKLTILPYRESEIITNPESEVKVTSGGPSQIQLTNFKELEQIKVISKNEEIVRAFADLHRQIITLQFVSEGETEIEITAIGSLNKPISKTIHVIAKI